MSLNTHTHPSSESVLAFVCLCVCLFVCARANEREYICKWWYKLRFFLYSIHSFHQNHQQNNQSNLSGRKKRFFILALWILFIEWHIRWLCMRKAHSNPFNTDDSSNTNRFELISTNVHHEGRTMHTHVLWERNSGMNSVHLMGLVQ